MMKQHILSYLFPFLGILSGLLVSCSDDFVEDRPVTTVVDDTNLVETCLSLDVAVMNASSVQTRAADDTDDRPSGQITEEDKRGTDAERKIDNIWVFQFDAATNKLLITPRYYDLSDKNIVPDATTGKPVNVLLKPDVASIVYVVANVGKSKTGGDGANSDWATIHNSATLDEVKKLTLPSPKYIAVNIGENPTDLSLPMEGGIESVTPTAGQTIKVQVTRMYAKVEIYVGDIPESLELTDVNVSQMPYYCQVGTLAPASPTEKVEYPIGHNDWNSYAFKPGTKDNDGRYTEKLVVYLPENLQGRTGNGENNSNLKTENAPDNALRVDFVANYVDIFTGEEKERGRHYAVYPGANNYNDYNIKRNCIYRVRLNIYTDLYNQLTPSSNCFVVKPNQSLSFLPYYRTETGGGYKFTDYLDAEGDDETKKINDDDDMLKNIKIIWQTKDAIGDNTNGDRVWIDRLSEVTVTDKEKGGAEFHRKIHVKTGKPGNALIAAYNNQDEIVWSWHIWVTENESANVSNAVVYSTYAWNERQIFTNVRVPGYAIMPCNLGALKNEPASVDVLDPDTHGMLYQWGRKDPFPPANTTGANDSDYSDEYTGKHYANDNETVVGKTAGTDTDELFHSLAGKDNNSSKEETLKFTIQNPTVFICGTKEAFRTYGGSGGENYIGSEGSYVHNGDWLPGHDPKLWGGLDPTTEGMKSLLILGGSTQAHIYDNYGDEKSIFDPCPSGWRVPPGDLWIGFTETGLNPSDYSQINTETPYKKGGGSGLYMYMTDWMRGTTSFFPTQGTRVPDGTILRTGGCGNYHNATTDINDRVNILHIHRDATLFRVFEFGFRFYYVKSTGGPVRCVRDHK